MLKMQMLVRPSPLAGDLVTAAFAVFDDQKHHNQIKHRPYGVDGHVHVGSYFKGVGYGNQLIGQPNHPAEQAKLRCVLEPH